MKQMRNFLLLTFAVAVLVITVRHSYAVWVDTQLTPKNLAAQNLSFTVNSSDADKLKQFEITVEPKTNHKLSPVLTARLHIIDGETTIATVPVEEKREGGKVTYWFRVAPKFLATSKFEFGEHGYGEARDAQGNIQYVGLPGGSSYWFALSDFAGSGTR